MLHKLELFKSMLTIQKVYGIGSLPFPKNINLSNIDDSIVPKTVDLLPWLFRLELMACHKIQELLAFPTSLTHQLVESKLLRVLPDLSDSTNLVELDLDDSRGKGNKRCIAGLWWIGRLSKLTILNLRLHNVKLPFLSGLSATSHVSAKAKPRWFPFNWVTLSKPGNFVTFRAL